MTDNKQMLSSEEMHKILADNGMDFKMEDKTWLIPLLMTAFGFWGNQENGGITNE